MAKFNDKCKGTRRRFEDWIDAHPRTGWYIAAITTLNTVLNILSILVH